VGFQAAKKQLPLVIVNIESAGHIDIEFGLIGMVCYVNIWQWYMTLDAMKEHFINNFDSTFDENFGGM